MKKSQKSGLCAILAAFTLFSCSKEEQPVPVFHMVVTADTDDNTKTVVSGSAGSYGVLWKTGDKLGVFEYSGGVVRAKAESSPLADGGASASFGLDIPVYTDEGPFGYNFVYPSSALSSSGGKYYITIPKNQTFGSGTFDAAADLLVSEHLVLGSRPSSVKARFARIGGTAKMVISAPSTSETIQSVTFSTTEANICGAYSLDPASGTIGASIVSGGSKSVTLTPSSATTYTGSIEVWFRTSEVTLTSNFTIKVKTNARTFTKTVNLASAGRSLSFSNSELSVFSVDMRLVPGDGWLEMPSWSKASMAGTTTSSLSNLYSVTHYATMSGSKARNYSILYDPAVYASYFVAYPLCSAHLGSGRDDNWAYDPDIPQNKQTNVVDGSYGVNFSTETYTNQLYSRGHQIPNADRNAVSAMSAQTFYATNATPQLQNGFNGGIWNNLEDGVRTVASNAKDTVYVVTGAAFRKKGGSETITTIVNKRDKKTLPVPNYYWKVLLKVKRGADGTLTGASAIGFWLEHRDNYASGKTNYVPFATTVDQIEEWTGFDFFANLPVQLQTSAESNSNWTTFQNYQKK